MTSLCGNHSFHLSQERFVQVNSTVLRAEIGYQNCVQTPLYFGTIYFELSDIMEKLFKIKNKESFP